MWSLVVHKLKYSTRCKKGGMHTFVKEEAVVAALKLDDSVFPTQNDYGGQVYPFLLKYKLSILWGKRKELCLCIK